MLTGRGLYLIPLGLSYLLLPHNTPSDPADKRQASYATLCIERFSRFYRFFFDKKVAPALVLLPLATSRFGLVWTKVQFMS
jgi:hypothetical protein